MKKLSKIIITRCLKPFKKDRILVITDTTREDLATPIFTYLKTNDYKVELIVMPPTSADGEDPEQWVCQKIIHSTAIIALTKWSLTHTKPMQQAKRNNAKIITLPAVTKEILADCLDVDYIEMKKKVVELADILTKAQKGFISTKAGSSLKFTLREYHGRALYGIAREGESVNLPDGEANSGLNNAQGTLVIDGSMPPDQESEWGIIGKIKTPIHLIIKDNYVIKILGGKEAKILSSMLKSFNDKSVYYLAELGIGLNPKARIVGNITEDEKVLGTIHIALGNNLSYGGSNYAPVHLDGIIRNPTLMLDEKKVINNGKLAV